MYETDTDDDDTKHHEFVTRKTLLPDGKERTDTIFRVKPHLLEKHCSELGYKIIWGRTLPNGMRTYRVEKQ